MNSVITLSWILGILQAVAFTYGEVYHYEPLRCFQCTGPLAPLCDGDDKQQYGERDVKCNEDLEEGQIDEDDLDVIQKGLFADFRMQNATEDLAVQQHPDTIADVKTANYNERRIDRVSLINNTANTGKYIRVKDGLRCWIMKVEYRAHGLIEVYKGCRMQAEKEFARITQASEGYRLVPYGYCRTFTIPELVGWGGERYYYAKVTACFCNFHNCNEKTLPHMLDNSSVGLEDVAQRKWKKKRKKSAGSVSNTKEVIIALFSVLAVAMYFIYR